MTIKCNFNYDNKNEISQGTIIGNFTDCKPIKKSVKILLGYNSNNYEIKEINSAEDLKAAVYDTIISCENKRLSQLNKKLKLYDLTKEEENYKKEQLKYNKFHKIKWPKSMTIKFKNRGRIEKEKRNKPLFQIVLYRGKNDKVFIHAENFHKTGNWHWFGWKNPLNIDFKSLYIRILETEEHCRQFDCFITEFSNKL